MDQDQAQSPAMRLLAAAYLLVSLYVSVWFLWQTVPEHRRRQLTMRLLRSSGQATRTLARRAAAHSVDLEMRTELQRYDVPYALGLLALQLDAAYDRQRGVTL